MYYYIYQVSNNINGKVYVGVHKTSRMDDNYMGSGKVIKQALKKYGVENFTKTILETFDDAESMYQVERELVSEEFLAREDVYNLRRGGTGGFDYINTKKLNNPPNIKECKRLKMIDKWNDVEYRAHISESVSRSNKRGYVSGERKCALSHDSVVKGILNAQSEGSRQKRIQTFEHINHQQGEKNSQFGTCWIWHEIVGNKKCKCHLLPEYIEQGWFKGRKLNAQVPQLAEGAA